MKYYLMEIAQIIGNQSYAQRKKVGAVISKGDRVISTGYNGTPPGTNNTCEDSDGNTKTSVIHAEANAILFAARNGLKIEDCTLYITMSPCVECAKMILASGIKEVFYSEKYRIEDGIKLLKESGVTCERITDRK